MNIKDLETKDLIDVLELAEGCVEEYIPSEIIEEVIVRLNDYDKLKNIASWTYPEGTTIPDMGQW